MGAGALVGLAAHQVECADPDEEPALGIPGLPRLGEEAEVVHEPGRERLQEDARHVQVGRQGQVVQPLRLHIADRPAQRLRVQHHVGVGEEQPLAPRPRRPGPERVVLA